jgi:diguanylate cyclase
MAVDSRFENGRRDGIALPSEQQDLVRLLCRAATRLAVAAQGIDAELDAQLTALRHMLHRDVAKPDQLAALVDAIDERIKHVDDERDQRVDVLQRELQKFASQLLAVKPAPTVARELKNFQKKLKQALADGRDTALLAELTGLQAQVLEAGAGPRPGVLRRWFGGDDAAIAVAPAPLPQETNAAPPPPPAAAAPAIDNALQLDRSEPEATAEAAEPPFTRISAAVCSVLNDLLRQIEPPPEAGAEYRHACEQIARGLNWYELVSTLEEVSLVVLATLQRGEGEFQQFLEGLNQRLMTADGVLQASRREQKERQQADSALNDSVRLEVAEMQHQVAEATELEHLKAEVKIRLESVVDAMDQHRLSEQQRQRTLEQQLNTLSERIREMEAQSAVIEQRMVEQRQLALLDPLTRLPNRQAYEEHLQQEYQRWLRYRRPLSLAVCDVDNFKLVNDGYGHLAGDKVLRIIARTLRNRLRKTDFIARFGGEEFVILMPETPDGGALQTLEAIRLAVANCPFHFREQPITITISVGIAAFVGDASPDTVFERADAALYRAKEAGRNCCVQDIAAAETTA